MNAPGNLELTCSVYIDLFKQRGLTVSEDDLSFTASREESQDYWIHVSFDPEDNEFFAEGEPAPGAYFTVMMEGEGFYERACELTHLDPEADVENLVKRLDAASN
jgi:hypothetical protein